eukprot:scaffold49593_cov63-Phaeocystis_antarctica.AAC.4
MPLCPRRRLHPRCFSNRCSIALKMLVVYCVFLPPHATVNDPGPRPRSAISPCVKVVSQARLRCTECLPDATDPSFLALQTYQQKQASRVVSMHCVGSHIVLHCQAATVTYIIPPVVTDTSSPSQ